MIVADASIVAKWLFEEPHSAQARALYTKTLRAGEATLAPPLLRYEVTNIIRQWMRREGITLAGASRLLSNFLGFVLTLSAPDGIHQRALEIAAAYGLRASYDAHYVALAEFLGCELWTDDQRLLRDLDGALSFVRWIGEYRDSGTA